MGMPLKFLVCVIVKAKAGTAVTKRAAAKKIRNFFVILNLTFLLRG